MRFVSDSEWQAAAYPPYVTTRTLTDAEAAEVLPLSVAIARATRNAERLVAEFYRQPVTFAELAALATDSNAAWAAWLDPLRAGIAAVAIAHKQHARLVALLGEDGMVLDHGWEAGREQISVVAIGEAVAAAEVRIAPIAALEKSVKAPARRAA